jgi:hypothetical protein
MSAFVSYSGDFDRVHDLVQALRRHGLRTWRDQDDLGQGAETEAEIDAALARSTAAFVWLGGQTMTSAFVRNIELPLIFRHSRERGLRVVPVFVDVTVKEGNEQVRAATGEEIASHNGYRWDPSLSDQENVDAVARAELKAELGSRAAAGAERPKVRMVTRSDGASARDVSDLNFDWIHEYPPDGTLPHADTVEILRRSLHTGCQALISAFGAGPVELHLKCHLHLGIALGYEVRRPTGLLPSVELDGEWQTIRIGDCLLPEQALSITSDNGPAGANRVAVELNVTRDVRPLVNAHVAQSGATYRKRVRISPPEGPRQDALTSRTLNPWADQIADVVRGARSMPAVDGVDLFLAAPISFAVALGWRLNAVGGIQIFHPLENAGPYTLVWSLPDS